MIHQLHQLFNGLPRYAFPFEHELPGFPLNGIYVCFEKGERYGPFDRIVRVGTHTGLNQLPGRLQQHYLKANKDRCIFRKNIGRCILAMENPAYLEVWNKDFTPAESRSTQIQMVDREFENDLEQRVSEYIRQNISFTLFRVDEKKDRLFLEKKLIATLAQAGELAPSLQWLGNHSPKQKIRESGLWQVNGLRGEPLREDELGELKRIIEV